MPTQNQGKTQMSEMLQPGNLTAGNRLLMAYLRHTGQIAQPTAAKRLFAFFATQAKRQVDAPFQILEKIWKRKNMN